MNIIVLRDVAERGRDIEGCIKQWFTFVKPNFELFVEPQRKNAGSSTVKFVMLLLTSLRYHCAKRC